MPYFGGSPFDTDVERATSELKTEEDWALIIEICDKINGTPSGPKDAMKSLMKRLKHSSPRVVLHALALLGACVDNCGKSFQIELCSREFYNFAFHALRKPDAVQVALSSRLKEMIQDWVFAFEGDSKLGLMKTLYFDLKKKGVTFKEHNVDKAIGLHTSHASSNGTRNETSSSTGPSHQDDMDLARAIELSWQEASESSAATPTSSGTGDSAIYYSSPKDAGNILSSATQPNLCSADINSFQSALADSSPVEVDMNFVAAFYPRESSSALQVSPTGHAKGPKLTSSNPVLNEISKCFDEESVHDLAIILLEKICKGGGYAFINQHQMAFGEPNWRLMALKVLAKWCDSSQGEVFGDDLLRVLETVRPFAARNFREKLLGPQLKELEW